MNHNHNRHRKRQHYVNIRLEMYGRAYQWLIMGPTRKEWWNVSDTDCTIEELKTALEFTITTDLLPLS